MRKLLVWVAALMVGCAGGVRPEGEISLSGSLDGGSLDGGAEICAAEGSCALLGGAGVCGDGFLLPGPEPAREACDDANLSDGDACDDCVPTPFAVAAPSDREQAYVTGPAPSAAMDDAGDVLVAWVETRGESRLVRARRYDSFGVPLGGLTEVVTLPGLSDDLVLTVTGLASGWVLGWSGARVDSDLAGVELALVSASGLVTRRVSPTTVTRDSQRDVRLARVGAGFVVAWVDHDFSASARRSAVRYQHFTASGSAVGSPIALSAEGRLGAEPAIASHGGTWALVWTEDDLTARRAVGMRFDGAARIDATPMVLVTGVHVAQPAIAALDTGDYAVAMVAPGTALAYSGRWHASDPENLEDDTFHQFGISHPASGPLRVRPQEPVVVALAQGRWMVGARLEGVVRGTFVEGGPGATLAPELASLRALLAESDARGLSLMRGRRDIWVLFSGTALGGLAAPRGVVGYLLPYEDLCRTCGGATPYCEVAVGTCHECTRDTHCGTGEHLVASCVDHACTYECDAAFADCDASLGCETSIGTSANCLECGDTCLAAQSCGASGCECPSGQSVCGATCVDLLADEANCGGCGVRCPAAQECIAGACACASARTYCDPECVDTDTDVRHCGTCGADCRSFEGVLLAGCDAAMPGPYGGCRIDACEEGLADCNARVDDGCEEKIVSSPFNCGACGVACRADQQCSEGVCGCDASSQAECGGVCRDILSDPSNCGGCGVSCTGGRTCSGGVCRCPIGQQLCGGVCRDVRTDAAHCGSCGNDCNALSGVATATCSAGACQINSCEASRVDCNVSSSDGCEANIDFDRDNCGSCGYSCAGRFASTGGYCGRGYCNLWCYSGWSDCDRWAGNGCETNVGNSVNSCGVCGRSCLGRPYATSASCSAGSCVLACQTGRRDCDGNVTNGCETNTTTDANNCGGCGVVCGRFRYCSSGTCRVYSFGGFSGFSGGFSGSF